MELLCLSLQNLLHLCSEDLNILMMKKAICVLFVFVMSLGCSYAAGRYSFKPERGYHGFLDFGYTIGTGDFHGIGRTDFSTSHGYQFNPYFFLGAGVGYQYCDKADFGVIPVFLDARYNMMKGRITPFLGLKAGYSFDTGYDGDELSEGGLGFYCVPSVGVRIILRRNFAANLSLGYTHQVIDYDDYASRGYGIYGDKESWEGVSIKAGIEFSL